MDDAYQKFRIVKGKNIDDFYSKRLHTSICAPRLSDHTEEAVIKMSLVADDVLAVLEGCESK